MLPNRKSEPFVAFFQKTRQKFATLETLIDVVAFVLEVMASKPQIV